VQDYVDITLKSTRYFNQTACVTLTLIKRLHVIWGRLIAKFHCTGPSGPARTFLRPGSPRNSVGSVRVSDKVRAGPVGPAQWNLAFTHHLHSYTKTDTLSKSLRQITVQVID